MRHGERLLRAAVASCVSTGLALALHLVAGGPIPRPAGVWVPLAVSFAASAQFAGRAMSRWRLAAAVTSSQLAFHYLFSLGTSSHVMAQTGHAGHHAHVVMASPDPTVAMTAHHSTGAMTVAHVIAAAGTYALLRRADVLLAWAQRLIAAVLFAVVGRLSLAVSIPLRAPSASFVARPAFARALRAAADPASRRGPPLKLA